MTTRRTLLAGSAAALTLPFGARWAEAQSPAGVIVMAKQIDDIISLDPGECFEFSGTEVCGNVYQKLVTTPNSNPSQITGELAESWEASADNRTFTFRLKQGPKFSSGQPVTAEDVAWSLGRAVILNKSPAFIINQFGFTKDNVAQMIRATDARTVVLQTGEATAPSFLLYCLSAAVGGVVEKAEVMRRAQGDDLGNAWLKGNSAGSGSYVVRAWRASESVTLEANPHSTEPPKTRRVIIRHMPDSSAQMLGLQRGDIDIARNLSPDQIRQVSSDRQYIVTPQRKANITYLSLNQRNPNLAKPEVRQAIKMAIDYEGIQKNIVASTYAVHQAFLPEGLPGALTDKPFGHQIAEAKALMARAGLADGFECSFDYTAAAPRSDIAQAIQANLAEIGIRLRMLPAEERQVITKTRGRQHDIAMVRWGSDYFDPNSNAEAFSINTDNSDNARNRTLAWRAGWEIPELSARTAAAAKETDAAKRSETYLQLEREHQQVSPFVVVLQEIEVAVSRAAVTGFELGPMNDRINYRNTVKA
ncbi:ABC transporter substrate-binding protein [Roseomonas sp. BN140053]|uniref:ABC transporter substrate-binding protein n=1 Tax=Roseomonas sp. BN140053 TaxID=3391898 RepID=UPI0039EC02AE